MYELAIFADYSQTSHVQGPGHPERPERLSTLEASLQEVPGLPVFEMVGHASREDLVRVHEAAYVDRLLEMRGKSAYLDPDTRVGPTTIDAATSAVNCGLEALNLVLSGGAKRAFSIVRPPGHHAERDRAMGFCYFNSVAILAESAIASSANKIDRVLIIDWDVHHGNGTQHSFEHRGDVAVVNLHQFPFYPGSGALTERGTGDGVGATLNLPLSAGAGDSEYLALFDDVVRPYAQEFGPDLVLVSAGYDAHVRDPLGAMNVTDAGFGAMARRVRRIADELCEGRLVATLEGGYDLEGLSGGVLMTCAEWMGDTRSIQPVESNSPEVRKLIEFHRT